MVVNELNVKMGLVCVILIVGSVGCLLVVIFIVIEKFNLIEEE